MLRVLTYGLDHNVTYILWVGMWLIFIGALCYLFNSAAPLWLLALALLWMI